MVTAPATFVVRDEEAGERLDKVVVRRVDGLGRRGAGVLFRSGQVTVDGRPAKKSDVARPGARVAVTASDTAMLTAEPSVAVDVALETESIVVVNKPGGLPTVPRANDPTPSLVGGLLARYPEMGAVGYGPKEPGLVHRLDTGTSGLIVSARTPEAFEALRSGLSAGGLSKRYLAIVEAAGLPAEGTIDEPLRPDRRSSRVHTASPGDRGARAARTDWRRLDSRGTWALLEITVARAYRHQIRVHLASIGHPIVGDALYGGPSLPGAESRHALHASYVAWAGDECVGAFEVDAGLPDDLDAFFTG